MELFTSIVCFSLSLFAVPNLAMADEKGVYVFPQVAAPEYSDTKDLQSDGIFGFGAGYRFDSPVAVEADFLTGDTSPKNSLGEADVDVWSIRALYHFLESDKIHPFSAWASVNRTLLSLAQIPRSKPTLVSVFAGIFGRT